MALKKTKKLIASMPDEKKWKIESDLRTLREAEAIKGDAKRMKACQELAQQEMMAMSKMVGG